MAFYIKKTAIYINRLYIGWDNHMKNKNNPIQLQEEDIMVRQQAFEWTKELFRYAKEDEAAAENFFHKLVLHDSVYKEYIYYMNH